VVATKGSLRFSFLGARKVFVVLALFASLFCIGLNSMSATTVGMVQPVIRVFVDARQVVFPDQVPIILSGRTLVPLRFVSEDLGATVEWDGATNSVTMVFGSTRIVLVIGRHEISVNGVARPLDVPAQIIGGRTMVPIRGIFESLGATVSWDQAANAVMITRQQATNPDGRIAFDPAVHILPDGSMQVDKAIEFVMRGMPNLRFTREADGRFFWDYVYVAPPELEGTGFEVELWSIIVQGHRSTFRHSWYVGGDPWIHDSLEVPDKQSLRREIPNLRDWNAVSYVQIRYGVRRRVEGQARIGLTGHVLINWAPADGIDNPVSRGWITPSNNRGPRVQYDLRRIFTWYR